MGFDVNDISSVLRERLKVSKDVVLEEVGYVVQIGDGVTQVYGLDGIKPGNKMARHTVVLASQSGSHFFSACWALRPDQG